MSLLGSLPRRRPRLSRASMPRIGMTPAAESLPACISMRAKGVPESNIAYPNPPWISSQPTANPN
ncbi:hypothetical protein [Bifidobacterium myosotis]|uniref:Uncharacterized protein n=1 Tax=Bifidobacterium myosotis TaxID=1630166 RepID=A0A5M9ZGJ8_9BIFI|nr:hypothetical protein [Bifidobacterium myosotis]KAA8825463.1 hypothetical protein EMO91_12320 [Bifidobacterium myosotis]